MRAQLTALAIGCLLLPGSGLAQAPQKPATPAAAPAAPAAANGEITLIGCLQRESDYRKIAKEGAGGILGSGLGTGDEYVLTAARPAPAAGGATAKAPGANGNAVGTAGTRGTDYSLSGSLEKELATGVGRMVEVVGVVEQKGDKPADGKAADPGELPRVKISVWHPVADFCPQR
jgi:hypothetical protein